jgi:hypothetical protein
MFRGTIAPGKRAICSHADYGEKAGAMQVRESGLVTTLMSVRVSGSLLFGVTPHDPLTLLVAVGSLASIDVVASLFPAARPARSAFVWRSVRVVARSITSSWEKRPGWWAWEPHWE